MKKYQVLSPDGFTVDFRTSYLSKREALEALQEFVERYKAQGYYSQTCYNGYVRRISLEELPDYCNIVTV